jgi:glyoxylase-like metal-dependent hydrolase (beta-lactamase superfamily II)
VCGCAASRNGRVKDSSAYDANADERATMATKRVVTRRVFLRAAGGAGLAVALLGVAGCAQNAPDTADDDRAAADLGPWRRVSLGFVSAYVLARDGEVVVVDTGVEGSADDIEAALSAAGVGWGDVAHVVLTHQHPDHVGSLGEVLARAADAEVYAGEADVAAIDSPRPITAVADGAEVAGLQVVATPGHTAGHISVLDPAADLLVAGDALNGEDGKVVGPNPQFTADLPTAHESVRKLAQLAFGAVVFGHGEPVTAEAAAQVAALAGTL